MNGRNETSPGRLGARRQQPPRHKHRALPEGSAAGQPIQGETGHTGLEPNKAAAKGQRVKRGQVTKTGKADWSSSGFGGCFPA